MSSSDLGKRDILDDDLLVETPSKCSGCFCERSMCLKMYCQCFADGKYCTSCNCQNCQNRPGDRNLRRKIREKNKGDGKYYHEAIDKEGFDCHSNASDDTLKTCRCSRSKCLKGYCDCFNAGKFCSEFCKCLGCSNKCDSQATTKKQNYYRWKNYMKTTQKENKKTSSRLDFIFLPTGSLYTHLLQKSCKQYSKSDESYTEIMRKLMKTFSSDYQKLSTTCNSKNMISHYCSPTKADDHSNGLSIDKNSGDKVSGMSNSEIFSRKESDAGFSSAGK